MAERKNKEAKSRKRFVQRDRQEVKTGTLLEPSAPGSVWHLCLN